MESRQPIAVALALQCLRNKEKFFNFPKKSCGAKNKGSKVHHSILFGSLHHFRLGAAAGSKVVDFESDKFGNPFIQKILQNYLRSPIVGVLRCFTYLFGLIKNRDGGTDQTSQT